MKMLTVFAFLSVFLLLAEMGNWVCAQAAYCNVGGCPAWALFVAPANDTLYLIANRFTITPYTVLQSVNNITNPNIIFQGQLLRIPFTCDCPSAATDNLSHSFPYPVVDGDEVITIATMKFSNLTTVDAIDSLNGQSTLQPGLVLQVPVNCSCGNPAVSDDYGMFGTYAAQPNDTLSSLSLKFDISQELLREYNPTVSFDPLQPFTSILFIPTTNSSGQYPPLVKSNSTQSSAGGGGHSIGIIVGPVMGAVVFLAVLGIGFWLLWPRYVRKSQKLLMKDRTSNEHEGSFLAVHKAPQTWTDFSNNNTRGALLADHCVKFTYDELALITDRFSLSRQIGKGGFATVFYGEWQGQKVAVKKMDMKETQGFLSEFAILSTVHHANLLDLIGYCTENYLFLVYEYMENETLTHHLRSGTKPMQWKTRVQIALDAARGVEYMHDHTRPAYIHRDLKPSNILLDSNFRAKVGDFGLTRLLDPDGDGWTRTTAQKGTYGYMAPEYAQFGHISVKLDVYAFGVILFQLISGREALYASSRQLSSLFEEALGKTDAAESIKTLVDPALGTEYPFESVWKMASLASRCTQKEPDLRPLMREVVMQLMMLSDFDERQFQSGAFEKYIENAGQ